MEDKASPTSFFLVKLPEGGREGGDKMNVPRSIQYYSNGQVALDERKSGGDKSISVKQIEQHKVKERPEDSMKRELQSKDNSVGGNF